MAEAQPGSTADRQAIPAGTIIFSTGDRADVMYIVQDGVVEVLRGETVVGTIGPGGILGEMGIVNHQPRSLTARAKFDCELKVLTEQRFLETLKSDPAFGLQVIRTLAARLRSRTES